MHSSFNDTVINRLRQERSSGLKRQTRRWGVGSTIIDESSLLITVTLWRFV